MVSSFRISHTPLLLLCVSLRHGRIYTPAMTDFLLQDEPPESSNPDRDLTDASERETAYLLRSETMRRRLLEAMKRNDGIPFEEVCEKLGIDPTEEKDSD